MGVAMQGLSKIFRAPIIKIIRYRAHRAVIFAIAWHLVMTRHSVWNSLPKNVDFSSLTIVLGIPSRVLICVAISTSKSDTFFLKNTVNISKRYKIFLKVQ